ncbi:hypothetical protein FRC05_002623 [Tulasnella sp. 425]|nr:hypothetical protein FRC05_002623 [Tulasnella sp. 425]
MLVSCRHGHLNVTAAYSRNYEAFAVFKELKVQSDLAHQPTQVRVVLELADIRILALGTLHHPKSFYANKYAKMLLHPLGIKKPFPSSSDINLPEPEPLPLEPGHEDEDEADVPPNQPQTPESPASPASLELEPTRSRESTHSISAAASALLPSVFWGRSWSTTIADPAAASSSSTPPSPMRGISIFQTRSLDEHAGQMVTSPVGPSSPGILSRLVGVGSRRRMSLSPPPEGQVLQIEQQESPQLLSSAPHIPPQGVPHAPQFANYPNYTPGDADTRWKGSGEDKEDGKAWAGPLLLTAQIIDSRHPRTDLTAEELMFHGWFANFGVKDLFAVAPWMMGKLGKIIDGHGLGI